MPSKYDVFWTQTAQEDLITIIDYISADSIDNALNIFNNIKKQTSKLNKFPARGRIVPELKYQNINKYREIIISPWRIIYKIENDSVFVFAVFDGRRNLEDLLLQRLLIK